MKKLKLEIRKHLVRDPCEGSHVMITPPIGSDYWLFRVQIFEDQYVTAFPKFDTIGIGFSIEDDWNCNLPYTCDAEKIRLHIWHNRRYIGVRPKRTRKAIEMLIAHSLLYMS